MFGLPIMQHCEDHALSGEGVMNEGAVATRLGLRGYAPRPPRRVMAASGTSCVLAEASWGAGCTWGTSPAEV